jgi:hypothetical protein
MKDMPTCLKIFDSLEPHKRGVFALTTMLMISARLGLEFNYARFRKLCEEYLETDINERDASETKFVKEKMIFAARKIGDLKESEAVCMTRDRSNII